MEIWVVCQLSRLVLLIFIVEAHGGGLGPVARKVVTHLAKGRARTWRPRRPACCGAPVCRFIERMPVQCFGACLFRRPPIPPLARRLGVRMPTCLGNRCSGGCFAPFSRLLGGVRVRVRWARVACGVRVRVCGVRVRVPFAGPRVWGFGALVAAPFQHRGGLRPTCCRDISCAWPPGEAPKSEHFGWLPFFLGIPQSAGGDGHPSWMGEDALSMSRDRKTGYAKTGYMEDAETWIS